jgi:hypothetical protein
LKTEVHMPTTTHTTPQHGALSGIDRARRQHLAPRMYGPTRQHMLQATRDRRDVYIRVAHSPAATVLKIASVA